MSYTVEDGTIVAGANSYITLVDARAYALDRGLTLPTDDTECEQALVRGADYIDGVYGERAKGCIADATQEMVWPRTQVYVSNFAIASGAVPLPVQRAQVQAAVQIAAGLELEPAGSSHAIKREKIGPLETEYQTSVAQGSIVPRVTAVERLMEPFLRSGGQSRTVRA